MPDLEAILKQLEREGLNNDSGAVERSDKMLNITRDTGEFFRVLVMATGARNILEIGTSNGYSTLWLASSLADDNCKVTTIESSAAKARLARDNFRRAGLEQRIALIQTEAKAYLSGCNERFDILFLDAERSEYMGYIEAIERILRPGGLMLVDNALSHADELEEFIGYISGCKRYVTATATIGKGEFMAWRENQ
jgi:predicted O-methyltransferase YrrM